MKNMFVSTILVRLKGCTPAAKRLQMSAEAGKKDQFSHYLQGSLKKLDTNSALAFFYFVD